MNALASAVTHIADFRGGLGWGISEPLAGTTSGRRDRRNFVICARYSEAAELRLPEGKVRYANHQGRGEAAAVFPGEHKRPGSAFRAARGRHGAARGPLGRA